MQYDLKKIKKNYGEKMSHLCRTLFPSILETEGLLYSLLESKFYPSRFLYDDIIQNNFVDSFKDFIFSKLEIKNTQKQYINKSPKELLEEAGYDFFECKAIQDVESFKKYYAEGERLCTFNNIKGRLNNFHVFFAVKKNVDEIRREDFNNPDRQDEYGTSVISIQVTKGYSNTISIKNRYNHTVENPDATFSNNLDNIIDGLTESFEQTYNLNFSGYVWDNFEMTGYVQANDGRFYKYNYEIEGSYYGPDNVIIDDYYKFVDYYLDKGRYLIFDYFILDMKKKVVRLDNNWIYDNFIDDLKNIDKVEIIKDNDKKYIYLKIKEKYVIIGLNKENKIISYQNDNILKIGNNFLRYNDSLQEIYLEKVESIGNCFLYSNKNLNLIYSPLLKNVGNHFLYNNKLMKDISMPDLETVGDYFLSYNENLTDLYIPKLSIIGNCFLLHNLKLTIACFPSLVRTGKSFISSNKKISDVYFPNLVSVDDNFLLYNNGLRVFVAPNLQIIGHQFLNRNKKLIALELPSLEFIETYYLENNYTLSNLVVPNNMWKRFIYGSSFEHNFVDEGVEKGKQKRIGTI